MTEQPKSLKHLIYTDMDGTLLDHDTYSFAPARCTLGKLHENNTPVIPNTSKTRAELAEIRSEMDLQTPFIVENGAAVYIPIKHVKAQPADTLVKDGYWLKEFARPRSHWLAHLQTTQSAFGEKFKHFDTMTVAEIQAATGLSKHNAELAKQREYGEPILWLGDEQSKQQFINALQKSGAKPIQGGRFLHLSGDSNKGLAMQWLSNVYQHAYPDHHIVSIALGDGQNDVAMLEAADIAVRITSPANPLPELKRTDNLFTSKAQGPQGWSDTIEQIVFNQHA